MAGTISVEDLTPEQRKRLGIRLPRKRGMTVHDVRTYALAALYPLRDLTRSDRARVLRQMAKMNDA